MRASCCSPLVARCWLPAARRRAHPLGNFTVNHWSVVGVDASASTCVHPRPGRDADIPGARAARPAVLARSAREVVRGLAAGGRRAARAAGAAAGRADRDSRRGRAVCGRRASNSRLRARGDGGTVELRDGTFPGRVGWRRSSSRPGRGHRRALDVPASDPTGGLRRYPRELLASPPDARAARLRGHAGQRHGDRPARRPRPRRPRRTAARATASARCSARGRAPGVSLLLLVAAFGWGAVHALSPGHGKAMVAAYLVGTRGTARHAVCARATVTVTHTIGVFALGARDARALGDVVPEDLYPWLNLVAGLLVSASARASCARASVAAAPAARAGRPRADHGHAHGHRPRPRPPSPRPRRHLGPRGLAAMGASAGIMPCPSALVVLLAAIAQHQVGLGLVLIVAFSGGLAATLTGLGLARRVVGARVHALSGRARGACSPRCRRRRWWRSSWSARPDRPGRPPGASR